MCYCYCFFVFLFLLLLLLLLFVFFFFLFFFPLLFLCIWSAFCCCSFVCFFAFRRGSGGGRFCFVREGRLFVFYLPFLGGGGGWELRFVVAAAFSAVVMSCV